MNEEITIEVPAEYIAVLKLFAAQADLRAHLNGIALEIGPAESRVIACDGARLGCFRIVSEQPVITESLTNICIPNHLLQHVKTKGRVSITIGAQVKRTDEQGNEVSTLQRPVAIRYDGAVMTGDTFDAIYPDYRRVFPLGSVNPQPAYYDARYVGDLAKAWKLLHQGKKGPCCAAIVQNGSDNSKAAHDYAALIYLGNPDFAGVIMPQQLKNIPSTTPPWVFDSLAASDAADLL